MLAKLHISRERVSNYLSVLNDVELCSPEVRDELLPTVPEPGEIDGIYNEMDKELIPELSGSYEDDFFHQAMISALMDDGVSLKDILEKYPELQKQEYGSADNIQQVLDYYKPELEDPDHNYAISIHKIYQNKENKGKGGGWRWHKNGKYIGSLKPECEYLDDEDFGPDWPGYIIVFHIRVARPELYNPEID